VRRSAYLRAIGEAQKLPTEIPELKAYFKDGYNPRIMALIHIKEAARMDTGALFDGELIEVLNAANNPPCLT